MQVGMEVIESAGDRFPPDSSSNSADPLHIGNTVKVIYNGKNSWCECFHSSVKPEFWHLSVALAQQLTNMFQRMQKIHNHSTVICNTVTFNLL